MGIDWLPFLSFTFITIFTPGPNNISSMSMGLLYGFWQALALIPGVSRSGASISGGLVWARWDLNR